MNTLTDMLRQAIREAPSLRAVARATGVDHTRLIRFRNGGGLMLEAADRLSVHFDIQHRRPRRKKQK